MAVSELHSRLEHLVTYSSQLIFVSGNSLGQQQQALEAFLSHQTEKTELAFLNGEPHSSVQSYRQAIQKQLLGDQLGLFNRPLNELLAPLNHHDGPVLICICQAEHLPQSFLQELWDLVLQSRFAQNKQHLNVLLFGNPQWAEQAKAWLPDNNRDRPLLLSTESISTQSPVPQPSSELDQLIARKREAFAKRLEARGQVPDAPRSTLAGRGFRIFIASVFIVLFTAILSWQYQAELLAWLQSSDTITTTTETGESGSPEETSSRPAVDTPQLSEGNSAQPVISTAQTIAADTTEGEGASPASQDDVLVTDWQSAIDAIRLPQNTLEAPGQKTAPEVSPSSDITPDTTPDQSVGDEAAAQDVEAEVTVPLVALEDMNPVEDYQVEDIVSVDQLSVPRSEAAAEASSGPEAVQEEAPALEANIVPALPTEVTTESALPSSELLFDEANLSALPQGQFVIQIAGLSDRNVLFDFIADNRLQGDTWLYRTQRYGGIWYVLLVNRSFPTLEAARAAIETLPAAQRRGVPFAKAVSQTQQEIRLFTNQ